MHDRVAELAGLRNELAICKTGPRETRREEAGQVQEQIDRVRGELEDEATSLEERAKELAGQGQDGAAGQLTEEARRIREALAQEAGGRAGARPKETAADSRPKETAAGRGSRASGKN